MENKTSSTTAIISLITGAFIGVAIGLMLAPKSGNETRDDIKEKFDNTTEKAKELALDKSKQAFETIKHLPQKKEESKYESLQKQVKGLADELNSIIDSEE